MVNEVTYSQLAKIAQEQGKNVAEVAKERGISEAQLADMKLQDAKLGGEMEAPGDVPQFSAYKKLDINGIKGILSVYDVNEQNGQLKLNNAALKELRQFGVQGLKLEDGVVYAQHKDGNEYPVGKGEDFNIQLAGRSNIDPVSFAKSVGKAFLFTLAGGAAAANPVVAGTVAAGAAAASCANDDPLVKVGGEERYDLGTTVNQNVNIPITLPVIDYTPYFNTLITQLNNLQNDQAKAFKLVIEGINALFQKTSATADDIEAILANLRKVVNNQEQQISITTKNHQDFQAFAAELMAILVKMKAIMQDTKLSVEEQTRQITELLDSLGISISNIESISSDTNQTVHDIYEKIDKLKGMFDDTAILEAIDKLAKKGDKANELLELIYEAMGSIGDKMNSYFGDLIKLAVQNNASLDDLKKLLKEINYNVQVNGEQAHDDAQAILEAIKKLGVDVSGDLAAILNAINSLPQSQQKDYTDALKAILDKINQGNVENNANFKAVLDAIKEHGAKVTVGMNKILEAIQNQPDYTAKLDAILKKLDALGAKAQEILEAIKDHDVKITVDVTGKVQCECNCSCGDGGKHEGIIGNLQDLLG